MAEQWHYGREGQQHGPVPADELRRMLRDGELSRQDVVWAPGRANWVPAADVPELLDNGDAGAVAGAGALMPQYNAPMGGMDGAGVLAYSMPQVEQFSFTPRAMEMLRQTGPWVRFIGVLMYIGAAFMLIGGLVMVSIATAAGARAGINLWMGVIYVPVALFYIMPAIYLNRYASRIKQLRYYNRADLLEEALEAQKSFWKFVGIVFLVVFALYAVGIVVFVAAVGLLR